MQVSFLKDAVVIFGLSSAVIVASHRLRVPPIIGFLLTGVLAGPQCLGLMNDVRQVEMIAEIGVILLLFAIGLELSLEELNRLKRPVFLGGGAQVLLTILVSALLMSMTGLKLGPAVFVGFLAALSSTAIVLKILAEKAQLSAPHGRIVLGALIFQDVAVVPMMLLVPMLAGVESNPWMALGEMALKVLVVGLVVFVGARKVVPLVLEAVVRTRSRELFLMATLGLCFSIALLTSAVGLSLSLGAFLAGLVMSDSEYSSSALESVLPFRDVFISVFFVSIGMLLDPVFVLDHLGYVLVLTVGLLVLKATQASLAGRMLGYPMHVAILSGLCLCQVGEFSFVLAGEGLRSSLLSAENYQYFLAAAIGTMAVTPFLIGALPRISDRLVRLFPIRPDAETEMNRLNLNDHLIIAGFGLGGRHLARAAKASGIPYVILEMNSETVRREREAGEPIFYGDASQSAVLEHIQVRTARVLAVVISDPTAIGRVVTAAKAHNPALHIVVRTRFATEIEGLLNLGAQVVVAEEYETSVEMFTHVLSTYLVPRPEIDRFVREIRSEGYSMLRRPSIDLAQLNGLDSERSVFDAAVLKITPGAYADGKSLIESRMRQEYGLTVVAVVRDGVTHINPEASWVMRAGDTVHVFGERSFLVKGASLFEKPEED